MLELLALPLEDENAELRADGLKGLRSLLWTDGVSYGPLGGGYMRDEYLKEAFVHMTALEQVGEAASVYAPCSTCSWL